MIKKIQLKNKLKVLFVENHKSPVISVQMWVKTGSADEPKNLAGISHFIEHLVFKGSEKFKVGEIAKLVESSGGEMNAYTSFDQTVFYVTISKQFEDTALDVISQMMGYPLFDKSEVDNEREVVIEEIKMGQDSLGRKSSQNLFSTVFKKHNYGRPVIGFDTVIRKTPVQKIVDYYHQRYVPENMFLVVTGDFTTDAMKKKVQLYFGPLQDRKVKKFPRPKEPLQKNIRIKHEKTSFNNAILYLAWRCPSVKHKDIPALEAISSVLGGGDTSRLVQKLRLERPLVNSVSAFAYPMQDDGVFAISLHFNPDKFEELSPVFVEEIVKITQEPIQIEELARTITSVAAHEIYSLETVDQLARKAGTYEFYMQDPNYFPKYLKQISQLTPEHLLKVASKYIKADNFSLVLTSPLETKHSQKMLKSFSLYLKKNLLSNKVLKRKTPHLKNKKIKGVQFKTKKTSPQSHAVKKVNLPNGHQLIFMHQGDLPHLILKSVQFGGLMKESGPEGQTELLSRIWSLGSKNYTEKQIHTLLEDTASNVYSYGGRNSIGLGLECLTPFQDKIFALYEDLLLNPEFNTATLEREKVIVSNQIQSRNDNPAQLAVLNFSKAFFSGHPYSRDLLGTKDSVEQIQSDTLKKYFWNLKSPLTFCAVGDFSSDKIIQTISNWALHLSTDSKNQTAKSSLKKFFSIHNQEEKRIIYELQKEQNHIVVGFPGLSLSDPRKKILEIIEAVLAGQGGRLFLELRDKNSLAYSVSPIHLEGLNTGYFGGYIGCSPEKTEKAIAMLKTEFEKLTVQKLSTVELSRAQRYLAGQFDIHLQKKSAICNSLLFDDFYGLDYTQSLSAANEYFSITADEVLTLAQELFAHKPVISIVGK